MARKARKERRRRKYYRNIHFMVVNAGVLKNGLSFEGLNYEIKIVKDRENNTYLQRRKKDYNS